MVNRAETHLDSVDQHGHGLRITFVWHRDRFAHTVALVEGGRLRPLLASLEGSDSDDWPPSPPLQHLTMEDRGDGHRVALLVGMAGTSHWSASIEPIRGDPGFVIDVACRAKEPPVTLCSTYRTMAASPPKVSSSQARIEDVCCLEAVPLPSSSHHLLSRSASAQGAKLLSTRLQSSSHNLLSCSINVAGSKIVVQPGLVTVTRPATVRWRYQFSQCLTR